MPFKITPAEFKALAPISSTISRLTYLMYDPNSQTSDIVRLIELDAALTANVLRWSNSAYFRSQVKVESVRTAVVRMGTNNILRLSIGSCLATALQGAVPAYGLAENELWRHNLTAALTAEVLGERSPQAVPPAVFTAALLHDVGKTLLGQHLGVQDRERLQDLMRAERLPAIIAERRLFETDHAEVGAAMASYWKFPPELVLAIERHHDLDTARGALLELVILSNEIAKRLGPDGADRPWPPAATDLLNRQGLAPKDVPELCQRVQKRLTATERGWGEEEEVEPL